MAFSLAELEADSNDVTRVRASADHAERRVHLERRKQRSRSCWYGTVSRMKSSTGGKRIAKQ